MNCLNTEKLSILVNMSKPLILSVVSELQGIPSNIMDIPQIHFQVLDLSEFEENPSKFADNVVAVLVMHGLPKVTKALLEKLPNLKLISVFGAGYNTINLELVKSFQLKLSNTANVLNDTVADMAMLLLMAAGRRLFENITYAMSPDLKNFDKNQVTRLDINNTTLGIVGMGRIGYKVAERAKAFNMKILYHNRSKRSDNEEKAIGATFYENLDAMLPLCDYVIVVVCLTPETTKMINRKHFKLMKSTAVFVNISRGGTVDQNDLVNALTSGEISFAALDVTTPEPLPRDHPLLKMPNVIITPHCGSGTLTARRKMMQLAVDNILAVVNGCPIPSEILLS